MSTPALREAARCLNRALTLLAVAVPLLAVVSPAAAAGQSGCSGSSCPQASAASRRITLETTEGRLAGDLYVPAQGVGLRGGAILVHGFLRPRKTMRDHAAALAARGVVALVPALPYQADPNGNARALGELSAQLRQGRFAPAVSRFVLIGFSAGALAAVLAAPGLPGLAGVVALDPFDRRSQPGRDSARKIAVPTTVVRAPPAACNGYGSAATWAGVLPQVDRDVLIPKATHCDFEAPTTLACRVACRGSDETRRAIVAEVLLAAVERYLPAVAAP